MRALRTSAVKSLTARPPESSVTTREIAELRQRVTRMANPCGCRSGAVMMIVALHRYPILAYLSANLLNKNQEVLFAYS
jgi:hypothetical protein